MGLDEIGEVDNKNSIAELLIPINFSFYHLLCDPEANIWAQEG